ncbi:MAG: serine/threonine protein kinase [Actinomycetes bacterium]
MSEQPVDPTRPTVSPDVAVPAWPQAAGYQLLGPAGSGSTGRVWLARGEHDGDLVALKWVAVDEVAARDRGRREAAALMGVSHPHLLGLRGVQSTPNHLLLVLDAATGGSLADLLTRRGQLDPGEAVTIAVPVAEALAAVHAAGFVHGDVSPANILFHPDGRPVLADLGSARVRGLGAGAGLLVEATPGFVAPEVRAGAAPGPAADVYALAAVVTAAVGGSDRLPAGLAQVVASCDHEDPLARPRAGELAVLLFESCPPRPVRGLALVSALASTLGAGSLLNDGPIEGIGVTAPVGPAANSSTAGGRGVGPGRRGSPLGSDGATELITMLRSAGGATSARRRSSGSEGHRSLSARRSGTGARGRHSRRVVVRSTTGLLVTVGLIVALVAGWQASTRDRPAATEPVAPGAAAASGHEPARLAPTAAGALDQAVPGPARAPTAVSGGGARSTVRWTAVVAALDARRADAFADADPRPLDEVYVIGCRASRLDRQRVAELAATHRRLDGVELRLREVQVVEQAVGRVRLRVRDVLGPYRVLSADGAVLAQAPGRPEAVWSLTLVASGPARQWLVAEVEPEQVSPGTQAGVPIHP